MGAVSVGGTENLLQYGAGIALPVAALGLFVGLRAWSIKLGKETATEAKELATQAKGQDASAQEAGKQAEGQE